MCGIRSAPRRRVRSYIHETGTFNARAISATFIKSQFHSFDDMPAPVLFSNLERTVHQRTLMHVFQSYILHSHARVLSNPHTSHPPLLVRYKENLRHTSLLTYSGMSGFIVNCPGSHAARFSGCGFSRRTLFAGTPSTFQPNFFM